MDQKSALGLPLFGGGTGTLKSVSFIEKDSRRFPNQTAFSQTTAVR